MHLFVFDYDGTLTSLRAPVEFVVALRQKHPAACIVLHTGASATSIRERTPGLLEAVDDLWEKPLYLPDRVRSIPFTHLVIVDDEPMMRSAFTRIFRDFDRPVQIPPPEALTGLIE